MLARVHSYLLHGIDALPVEIRHDDPRRVRRHERKQGDVVLEATCG